ncbi:hypothetical protein QFC21_002782 [Naganishia friedmannii]|uniref:Uncharacterized protein n=1 Tax=Naganishia friedmannii TaxID=89922 RepID=A0ACC2VSQ2_9TREE|nr:hypothetical protein QFC21_002782 [Naganishia friedmannii]
MQNLSAEEQRWLIRIILKDLKAGVREKTVLSAFHPQAIELFNVSSDLKRVCWMLADRHARLNEKEAQVTILRPFLPQLCKRLGSTDLNTVVKMMSNKPFLIEQKLDGERIQLHKKGDEYMFFSRKGHSYSYLYGEHVGAGTLTPYIHEAFNKNVRECILDGEMLVWDPLLGKHLAFGTLKSAALDTSQQQDAPRPCFKVFDILMLNGTCLTSYTLRKRREVLFNKKGEHRVFEPVPGRMELADLWEGKDASDIKDRLEWVMENRGEGLVVKNPLAAYELNGRSEQWVKVKPEYADELGENLDVFVLGGWWGTGRRGGKISSLLFGLRIEQDKEYEGQTPRYFSCLLSLTIILIVNVFDQRRFKTFGRVGGGLSFSDHKWLEDHHGKHFKDFDRANPPSWIQFGPVGLDDKPDVIIRPEHSFVIEVKASEIISADGNFAAELTLRFPRVKHIRHDRASSSGHARQEGADENVGEEKVWDAWDSLSLQELIEFNNQRQDRIYAPSQQNARKKRKVTTRRVATISSSYAGQEVSDTVISHTFRDKMFYIIRGTKAFNKDELERLVTRHGGDYCQQRTDDNDAIVISSIDTVPTVKGQIKKGVNIVKPEWIIESIKRGKMLPFTKEWLLSANEETRASRSYRKTTNALDSPSGSDGEHLDGTTDQDANKAGSESDDSDRKHKPAYVPPEDIDLGDQWTLRNVKTDRVLEYSESEAGSGPGSDSENLSPAEDGGAANASPEYASRVVEPIEAEETDDDIQQPRFVPEKLLEVRSPRDPSTTQATKPFSPEPPLATPPLATPAPEHSSMHDAPAEKLVSPEKSQPPSKMGETDADIDYDDSKYFRHLVFYLDTNANAARHRLTPADGGDDKPLRRLVETLEENGGRVTDDLYDPKLTHVVCSGSARFEALMRAFTDTSK